MRIIVKNKFPSRNVNNFRFFFRVDGILTKMKYKIHAAPSPSKVQKTLLAEKFTIGERTLCEHLLTRV